MTSLVTQEIIDVFQSNLGLLERALREHVMSPLGHAHNPNDGFKVVVEATFMNASGTLLGNATLRVTMGDVTFYVPARVIP
jgi:hypothetical protein